MGYQIARIGKNRSPLKMLTDKLTGKRIIGRSRRRWKEDITTNL